MDRKIALTMIAAAFVVGGFIGNRIQNYRWVQTVTKYENEKAEHAALAAERAKTGLGVAEEALGKLSIFILAGQSNMSGRGELPLELITHPRVFKLANDGRWKVAAEPVDNHVGQVDFVSADDNAGVSPGMTFALELLEQNPDMYIGLVPVARGGTSLYQWRRNLSDTTLYGSFLKRARAATAMGKIEGFLWFQGEADTHPPDHPVRPTGAGWKEGFEEFIGQIRADLHDPNLPVVYAQIGTQTNPQLYPQWEAVKSVQPDVDISRAAMITTEDLKLMDDVHFTADSYEEIGRRFARAYLELIEKENNIAQN